MVCTVNVEASSATAEHSCRKRVPSNERRQKIARAKAKARAAECKDFLPLPDMNQSGPSLKAWEEYYIGEGKQDQQTQTFSDLHIP